MEKNLNKYLSDLVNPELTILNGGSPAILRTHQWTCIFAGLFLVLSLAMGAEMRVAAMIPLVFAAVVPLSQ